MKTFKYFTAAILSCSILASPVVVLAEGIKADAKSDSNLKPYTLKSCIVSGHKLGEMGEPFVYKYKDRAIKFCCKGCLKDFNKEPAKYVKKIEAAEAKAKK